MINPIAVILPVLFLIILIFGTGEDRIRSSFLFFLYTLAGSLFMLLAILQIYNFVGSTDFTILSLSQISLDSQIILWAAFFLALAVKTPLVPVHMWLPRAHTSAPLGGSILLAGTVLKFATYGMLRLLIQLFPEASNYCNPFVQVIAIITLIYASLATILQQDTKTLIAYSSICHMAVVVLGIFSNNSFGIIGAILLGIAHGFVSPALFLSVGGIIYDRFHRREIAYLKGLALKMPVFITLFFIFILANTGIPLTLNFLGEQLSLIGLWERNPIITVLGSSGIVLSACYSVWMYNRISYGSYSKHLAPMQDLNRKEFNLLLTLLIPTIILGIFPDVILDSLHLSVSTLLYTITGTPIPSISFLSTSPALDVFMMPLAVEGSGPVSLNEINYIPLDSGYNLIESFLFPFFATITNVGRETIKIIENKFIHLPNFNNFKSGWNLNLYPKFLGDIINNIENFKYVQYFKYISIITIFLVVTDYAKSFYPLFYEIILIIYILFTIYRIFIALIAVYGFINIIFRSNYINLKASSLPFSKETFFKFLGMLGKASFKAFIGYSLILALTRNFKFFY